MMNYRYLTGLSLFFLIGQVFALPTVDPCCHAGENRHPVLIDDWIPAFAGMTFI